MPPKPKRIVDKALLKQIKSQPCLACRSTFMVDPAHIRSVGSGGPDTDWNVIPLSRDCHTTQHFIGWKEFFARYPQVWNYLETLGWYWLEGKLWNDKLTQ